MRGLFTFVLTVLPSALSFSALTPSLLATKGLGRSHHLVTCPQTSAKAKEKLEKLCFAILMVKDDSSPDEEETKEKISKSDSPKRPNKSSATTKRIGGRSKSRSKRTLRVRKPNKNESGPSKWLIVFCVPLFVLWLFFQTLVGEESPPSTYYYQSSVYESRIYNADGKVETSRKESFRSNVPGLVEERSTRNERQEGGPLDSSYFLRGNPDKEFDRELESMMRIQQKMLDDFFR